MQVQRGYPVRARRLPAIVRCAVSDNSVRVHGKLKKVYKYVTNFQHLENWYSGVAQSQKLGGSGVPVTIGTRFSVKLQLANFKALTTYEIVDMKPDRQCVYSGNSEMHVSTDQFIFLQDPNDPNFTVVRYVADVKAKKWQLAMEPLLAGAHKQLAEQSLRNLATLLNGMNSPLRYMEDEHEPQSSKWSFGQLFNTTSKGQKQTGSRGTTNSVFSMPAASTPPSVDAYGYYQLLGLDPRRAPDSDTIKGAYRQLALQLHPDRLSSSSVDGDEGYEETARRFQMIKKAYEVLKDPETRRLYDQGKLVQEAGQR